MQRFDDLFDRVHLDHEPVFVLNPGRSGSLLVTRILALDGGLRAVHEPRPEFTWHNTFAFEHPDEQERIGDMFDAGRYEYIRDSHLTDRRYVETNNRITFFARAIASLYPQSKFVHLVRHPSAFVKSGLPRGWYTGGNLYDASRPTMQTEDWQWLSRAGKIAWLWEQTHKYIDDFKAEHPDRVHTVLAENLFGNSDVAAELFQFIGRPIPARRRLSRVVKRKANANTKGRVVLSAEDEEEIQRQTPTARKYYPLSES